jgi:hypothetical protein
MGLGKRTNFNGCTMFDKNPSTTKATKAHEGNHFLRRLRDTSGPSWFKILNTKGTQNPAKVAKKVSSLAGIAL